MDSIEYTVTKNTPIDAFELVKKPMTEIKKQLDSYHIQVMKSSIKDTHILKFHPSKTDTHDNAIKHLKGLIFHKTAETSKILACTYPVPVEVKNLEIACLEKEFGTSKFQTHNIIDGSLMGLWYNPTTESWTVSTNAKVDASKAFWLNGIIFQGSI